MKPEAFQTIIHLLLCPSVLYILPLQCWQERIQCGKSHLCFFLLILCKCKDSSPPTYGRWIKEVIHCVHLEKGSSTCFFATWQTFLNICGIFESWKMCSEVHFSPHVVHAKEDYKETKDRWLLELLVMLLGCGTGISHLDLLRHRGVYRWAARTPCPLWGWRCCPLPPSGDTTMCPV